MWEAGLEMLAGLHPAVPVVLAGLGTLVLVGGAVVALTPSQADDKAWAKIKAVPVLGDVLKLLTAWSPLQKNPSPKKKKK